MKINDIYTAYVSWPGGGKRRPVLILSCDDQVVRVFKITSKFHEKSAKIRKYYYPIQKWQDAGLNKQSYIDTICQENLLLKDIKFLRIGRLQLVDIEGLRNFLKENNG